MPVRGAAELRVTSYQFPVINPVDLFSVGPGVIFAEARRKSLLCEFLWRDLIQCRAARIRLTLTFAAEVAVGCYLLPHIIIH